ncbi:hypothetical protein BOX15_Mlig025654g1, partial [Macrostomum lignano]
LAIMGKLSYRVYWFIASVFYYHFLAVMFGAPFFSEIGGTFAFSLLLASLTVLPFLYITPFDDLNALSFANFLAFPSGAASYMADLAILGSYCSAVAVPLDWDRWWQRWPIPGCAGCLAGAGLGLAVWAGGTAAVRLTGGASKKNRRRLD